MLTAKGLALRGAVFLTIVAGASLLLAAASRGEEAVPMKTPAPGHEGQATPPRPSPSVPSSIPGDKQIVLTLTASEVGTIWTSLQEAPFRIANPLMEKIRSQLAIQVSGEGREVPVQKPSQAEGPTLPTPTPKPKVQPPVAPK